MRLPCEGRARAKREGSVVNRLVGGLPVGVEIEGLSDGSLMLRLREPIGAGGMVVRPLSPHLFVAIVDFRCEACPNFPLENPLFAGFREPGAIFTVNYCQEGRCEVALPGRGFAVVKPGDLCVSCVDAAPEEYRYPTGRYRGVELFAHAACADDSAFGILRASESGLESSVRKAGLAAIYFGNVELNETMERIERAFGRRAEARLMYESLGLLLALCELDLGGAKPPMLLTRSQMSCARAVRESIEANLYAAHDVREYARRLGVGASTLNNYFSLAFGQTVAAYVRRRRLEEGAKLLARGLDVATASLRVGYKNPSKFAAAFKRAYGATPTEFRREARLGERVRASSSGKAPATPSLGR